MTPQRQHPRYAHDVAVRVQFGDKVAEGRTRNVSRGGLCANVSLAIPTGTDVTVEITLVFDDDMQSEALSLPARIAWCTTVDNEFQIGVSFKPLDAERAELIGIFLRYLEQERAPKTRGVTSVDEKFG